MTQETFEAAINLHHRLEQLVAAKDEIDRTCRLIYQYEDSRGNWLDTFYYKMQYISDILDRHDKMIREEIDKEIEDINKQIAEL